jgi:hypothetical protein
LFNEKYYNEFFDNARQRSLEFFLKIEGMQKKKRKGYNKKRLSTRGLVTTTLFSFEKRIKKKKEKNYVNC